MYEILQINDMLQGASLMITIEESDLDKKALYTIEEAKPSFILPFRTRAIDGKIEFVYQVSTLCKLQYMTGDSTVQEYVQLWRSVLSPLLECDDWFMRTQSFVLDVEYLYFDKERKGVSFVYIPTLRVCSEREDLKKMVGELAKLVPVMDMTLENKVLRMIMDDFKPKKFLGMLNEYIPQPISSPLKELQTIVNEKEEIYSQPADYSSAVSEAVDGSLDDIFINMSRNDKSSNKPKETRKLFGKSEKRKKKATKKAISSKKASNGEITKSSDGDTLPDLLSDRQELLDNEQVDDATQLISVVDSGCVLRLVGSPLLPSLIGIEIEDGEAFTIGRYDATVGRKQSSFEFERKTKAISRRHAAIEKHRGRYSLIDLSSRAGTFINGQKLPPNTPMPLENGAKVSLGTSGADYVFELREES